MSRTQPSLRELWGPRVGSAAAKSLQQSYRLRVGAIGGILLYALIFALVPRDTQYVAYVELIIPIASVIGSLVEYQKFYRNACEALGIDVGFGAGIPTNEAAYRDWCAKHGMRPNPFEHEWRLGTSIVPSDALQSSTEGQMTDRPDKRPE